MIKRVEIVLSSNAGAVDKDLDGVLARMKLLDDPKVIKLTVEDGGALSKLAAAKGAEDALAGSTENRTRATTSEAAALLATARMQASCNEAMGKGIAAEIGMATYADKLRDALGAVAMAEQLAGTEAGKAAVAQSDVAVSAFKAAMGEGAAAQGAADATRAFMALGQAEAFVNGEQEKLIVTSAALSSALSAEDRGAFMASLGAAGMGAKGLAAAGGGGSSGGGAGFLGGLLGGFGLGGGKGRGAFWGLPSIPLFAGIGSIGAIHAIVQGILEISATLIPAMVAMTAFGIAGSDAANNIIRHFTDLHTVMDATGQDIYPMTGAMEALHKAAQPAVYQVLGDAISVMTSKTGEFRIVALQAGQVIDQLAARTTIALTSGGFSSFMQNAAQDLYKWGTLVGNIFGILGNVLKALPGYAGIILNTFVALTHGIEVLTAQPVVQWALHLGLAFHGAAVYGGLLVSGVALLVPWLSRLVTVMAGAGKASTALSDLGTAASSIEKDSGKVTLFDKLKAGFADVTANAPVVIGRITSIGAAEQAASGRAGVLGRATSIAVEAFGALGRILPIAGVAALGLAVVGVVDNLRHVDNATAQWIQTLQTGLGGGPVRDLLPQIHNDISAINDALAKGPSKAFIVPPAVAAGGPKIGGNPFSNFIQGATHDWDAFVSVLGIGTSKFGELTAAVTQFRTQGQQVSQFVLAPLAKEFGGNASAMGLMSAAGITSKQVLDAAAAAAKGNLGPLLALHQQIMGTAQGFKAMGQQGGMLGNDLEMLDRQATDSYKAAQTLNQGWDAFIGNMTSTQSNFDTFALGMKTLDNNAQTIRHHLGDTSIAINGLGHSMDGLNKSDIALNQAFTQQVTNANAMIDTWRQAGVAGNLFSNGVKGSVAELLRFAKGSPEALAQLTALAEEAGYKGPAAFSDLSKWVGNTHDALLRMKDAANQATIQDALLSSSMRAQGQYISSQLISDINQATLKYYGVQKAAEAYGNAVAKDGQQSDAAHAARARLITDIIASGKASHDTTAQIAAMITKILGIPTRRAIQIVEHGTGSFSVTQLGGGRSITSTGVVRGGGGHTGSPGGGPGGAHGLFVKEGTTPTADDVLARVSKGELIVPAHMVTSGLVDHLRGHIPGFAAGGVAGANPSISYDFGQAAQNFNASFTNTFTGAMESAMSSAVKAAQMAAMRYIGGGPSGGSAGAAAAYARSLLPRYGWSSQWPALNSVAMAESGWNMFARNPSSGAYGIAQFINGPSEYAQYGGNAGTIGGQVVGFLNYIRARYGSPNAAWAHEAAYHWYANGMTNGVFSKPTLIGVGESGPEMVNVTPLRNNAAMYGAGASNTTVNVNVAVPPSANKNEIANEIWMMLRNLKRVRKMNLNLD